MEIEGENNQRISTAPRQNGMRMVAGRLSRAFGTKPHLLSVSKVLADKERAVTLCQKIASGQHGYPGVANSSHPPLHLIQQRKQTPFAQTVGALKRLRGSVVRISIQRIQRTCARER
jgi:uncharacterized protein (DUF58 family)